jgi:hypothetical protein
MSHNHPVRQIQVVHGLVEAGLVIVVQNHRMSATLILARDLPTAGGMRVGKGIVK